MKKIQLTPIMNERSIIKMGIQQRALQEQLSNPADWETRKLWLPLILKAVWEKRLRNF